MEYKSEEEFLKNYDSSCFEKLSCTTDIALFSVSNEIDTNYRKLSHKFYSVLLVKRKNYPFKDKWCLPGGFIRIDEDLEDAPKRILKEETNIDDVYLDNDITIKEANIPVTEVIYSNSEDLAQYLLYGGNTEEKTYVIKEGDTIESVSYDNQINPEEFLISNPSFTSINNLLFVGQSVIIKQTNPQIQVVEEKTVVEDQVDQFQTIVKYDNNKYIGDDVVEQEGQNGTNRVNMKIKYINNSIAYINTISKNVITPTVDKIVVYGNKYASAVGSTSIWKWPCDSHYITSHFARFRINPVTGRHESHQATDIYNPYNSRIYAANNGTVVTATWHWSYGNYVVIDHNNGFATLYAHMNSIAVKAGQTVNRGQVIGYVGSTGIATGPHLHFEAIKTSNNMKFDAETLRYQ